MRLVVVVLILASLTAVIGLSRGTFDPSSNLLKPAPKDFFPTERILDSKGGIDFGKEIPDRSRRPQPDYDNYVYAAPNFYQHEIVYLEDNLVLDWQPSTGEYRIFKIVRHPADQCPAIPERPINSGVWEKRKFHKLIYIGCNGAPPGGKMFDYDPDTGTYDIFRFNHKAGPDEDPMMESMSHGFRREILNFQPVWVNDDEILFYERATGKYSVYYLNNQLPSIIDPIQPPEPIAYGKVSALHEQLIYMGKNMIMDYDPLFGRFWLFQYDRSVVGETNPFVGPLGAGTIQKGMVPTYMAEDQIVLLDPETGYFSFADINRPPLLDVIEEEDREPADREAGRVDKLLLRGEDYQLKQNNNTDFGYGTLIRANQCADRGTCRGCLKLPGCGWCDTNKSCWRGGTAGPCVGNCTSWDSVFCEAEPCSQHRLCTDCLSDPFCGWCETSGSCQEGVTNGPLFGECAGWSKVTCPNLYGNGPGQVTPCVEDGLISL